MSAPPPSFKIMTFDIVLGDPENPTSWESHRVRALPKDEIMAGDLIAKHKQWPNSSENQTRFGYMKGFYALKRIGVYAGSWEQFEEELLDLTIVDQEDVPPTRTATGDDSEQKSP